MADIVNGLLDYIEEIKPTSLIVLADENTARHCLPEIIDMLPENFLLIALLPGEEYKNLDTASYIWKTLMDSNADRNALLLNLGGGVITDIGGFCASTYKRGIKFINIPTTLIGMADAAMGHKNGIDFNGHKNQIGVFSKPEYVAIYIKFLNTLPVREVLSGFAEVMKYGLISDKTFWGMLRDLNPEDTNNWLFIVQKCIDIKRKIVNKDPFEKGQRKILNFGHTAGHALESHSMLYDRPKLTHGEAVAAGMIIEAHLSWAKTGLPKSNLEEISSKILKHYKPYPVEKANYKELMKYMENDKKNRNQKIKFALLKNIGKAVYDIECSSAEISEALDYYCLL